jgi:hypothetical protein
MANQQPMKGLAMVFVVNSLSLNHLKDFALLRHLELEDPDLPSTKDGGFKRTSTPSAARSVFG